MTVASAEEALSARVLEYCDRALDRSAFFGLLRERALPEALLKYAFVQYRFFRDQLHRWFGLCILKAASTSAVSQRDAVMALGGHVFSDLRDGHDLMFAEFLRELGVTDEELGASRPSPATVTAAHWFFAEYGYGTSNFYQALAALSGRELCVAVRNGRLIRQYFDARSLKHPTWISLHAELELEHFHDALRPALAAAGEDPRALAELTAAVELGIERHTQYFDGLLAEYEARMP